jgi:hypothetical protein
MNDDRATEPDMLRKSLEILEEQMENMFITEEPSQAAVIASQPRKSLDRTGSFHSHPDQDVDQRISHGQLTPPVIFPQKPGTKVAEIETDADVTPVPAKTIDMEDEPTPKPARSPLGSHSTRSLR